MSRSERIRDDRGFALVIVLWTLAILALVVARAAFLARTEVQLAVDVRGNLIQGANADGAIYAAAFELLDHSAVTRNSNGASRTLLTPHGTIRVRITDEADKVNLNSASADLLRELLVGVGINTFTAVRLSAAIVDWREEARPPRRPEDQIAPYKAAGLTYLPPLAPFRSIDEVGVVLGMTPSILRRLRPHVTIYSTYGPTRSTADAVVLDAIKQVRVTAGVPPLELDGQGVRVVRIIATAVASNGTRFTRNAVLRLNPGGPNSGGNEQQPVSILSWETGEDASR